MNGDRKTVFEYDFSESEHNREPFFTDYPVDNEENMELETEYHILPELLNTNKNAHFISAFNKSDDVKMMFRRQVHSPEPNDTHNVEFEVHFATETPSNCVGIGGPPVEAVKVIATGRILNRSRLWMIWIGIG